ncbi:MAG: hypothetical protein UT32_C0002G0010 [Parcubacteria group bacterium GW2011_GWC2_39_14]|nr:MAG: hypothetical protein UT32_C0002G0010 [Parcubacteria group bacterium GW2011_GWC2_39_14]KKR55235.1 MAG: hypothetical protein UT91_C0003G0010 [Parcubacteria group bacterium GW2011_GWA2_40_23]
MSAETLIENSLVVHAFLAEKGWRSQICTKCGSTFFIKTSNSTNSTFCGWHKCNNGTYPFRTLSKRKSLLTIQQINTRMREYFRSVGFIPIPPLNIANAAGQTDLVIAGVQVFDNIIHNEEPIREDPFFISQPCVRMQFQPQVESQEGTSSSFVNVCTEKMGAGITQHLQTIDQWCTFLSQMGLHMNDFVLVLRTRTNDWGTGAFQSLELFFSYGGLELGDAAFVLIPQANRDPIPISDIGFGLERIAWAVNKTASYFDLLTPWTSTESRELHDACRTLSLLVLCGVQASNKGPGLQFRRFAKLLSEKYYGAELYALIQYYYNYWAQFIEPHVDCEQTLLRARLEIERFINRRLCAELKLPRPDEETTEDYLNRLVYLHGANLHELRNTVQTCKRQR